MKLFALLILFFSIESLHAQSCLTLLKAKKNQVLAKELQKLEVLNPELLDSFYESQNQDLRALYVTLKQEGWRVLPQGMVPWKNRPELSEELKVRLRSQFARVYSIEGVEDEKLYLFYANALQGRYIAVANALRLEFIKSLSEKVLSKQTKVFLALVYESLLVTDLGRAETSPESALEALLIDLRGLVDWPKLIEISESFKEEEFNSFDEWINGFSLELKEKQLLRQHLGKKQNPKKYCCKNNPGCLFCPNNRGFLRQLDF
jgi:hypothetical protein